MGYDTQEIVNYNDDPPADDGSAVVTNQVKFSKVKDELADPIRTLAEAINTELLSAFSQLFLGSTSAKAVDFNVGATTDAGTLFDCTADLTATLPPAADAGDGFAVVFLNNTGGTLTIDANGAETINGNLTITSTNDLESLTLVSDSSKWFGIKTVPTAPVSLLDVYPIGSIFMSVVATNPNTFFGGTWVAIGAGRVLVGIDAGDSDFDVVEETGGSKTHTLTTPEISSHDHTIFANDDAKATGGSNVFSVSSTTGSGNKISDTTGGGGAHNNVQPYLVVHMFKRTA